MTARKLSDVEVEGEVAAKSLDGLYDGATMPLEAMRASAELRRLSLRIARVEKDLATERRLHRDTERRAEEYRVERDIARRERDQRPDVCNNIHVAIGRDLDALAPNGIYRGSMSDADFRDYLLSKGAR